MLYSILRLFSYQLNNSYILMHSLQHTLTQLSPSRLKKQVQYIGHYEEAPSFMKDNDSITHGYRINFNNPRKIIKSLFMIHNESVNIWTHLLPAIAILILISYFLLPPTSISKTNLNQRQLLEDQNIDFFTFTLNNLTCMEDLKDMTVQTTYEPEKIEKVKESFMKNYDEFVDKMTHWRDQMEEQVKNYQDTMKSSWKSKIEEFDKIKNHVQRIMIPYLINQVNTNINSTYVEEVKHNLNRIKQLIDSQSYEFLEGAIHTPNPHEVSRWPIVVFLVSALACLTGSAMFHLFYPMSGRAFQIFNRLDHAGINILIAGSCFPPLYYGLYCNMEVATFYLSIICFVAFCLFVTSLFEWIHKSQNIKIKSLMYGGFGISLSIPISHLVVNEVIFQNYGDPYQFTPSLPYYISLGASYLFGLYVYVARCPQRKYPGKFNLCGHSHQIWHCFVVMGIIFTYVGVLQNFQMRKISTCPIN